MCASFVIRQKPNAPAKKISQSAMQKQRSEQEESEAMAAWEAEQEEE